MTQRVWVTVFTHEYGEDVKVYDSAEKAQVARQELALYFWAKEMGAGTPIPSDDAQAATDYFDTVEERGEFFQIFSAEVE